MRVRFALALIAFALFAGAASAQEMATEGVFKRHGVVKAVGPRTGALTLSHDDIRASCA